MISIQNFLDCPDLLPMVAERVHTQWFADKPAHTAEGMLQRMRGSLRAEVPIGLIAFLDGTPAGTISLVESDLDEREDLSPWIAGLLVFPDFRNKGVGSALLQSLMDIAKLIGLETIYLYTDKPDFYEKFGWKKHCKVSSYPGCDVMRYEITSEMKMAPEGLEPPTNRL
jgi:predicted N-acetyltransferase YhbS